MKLNFEKVILPIFIVFFAAIMRVMPHPANFAPIGAMALFGGAVIPNKKLAVILPLGAMFLADIFLGFHSTMIWVYGSFILISLIGISLRKQMNFGQILLGSIAGSLLFFTITNFGVWLSTEMYPKTISGLMDSYFMGLPFLRGTFLGDLFYNGIFFGSYFFIIKKVFRYSLSVRA